MSFLRFVTGPSGSGKSTYLYKEITERAEKNRKQNFFFIVPDQAAMSTQAELVKASRRGGILNIDVLGFGRLSHRILEETGQEDIPVLDDTGMSLIIQKVSLHARKDLPVLGKKIESAGVIAEIKSAISEFMQYGISPDDMEDMIDSCLGRGGLRGKLRDLRTIYSLFEEYIGGHYITREEKLDILCNAIPSSSLLPDSVIVFDGFTGFTPVQMKVIGALMERCSEMIVTLECSDGEDIRESVTEDELFYLSHKTASALIKLASEKGLEVKEPEMQKKALPDPDISLLEKNLFRKKRVRGTGTYSYSVNISEMSDPGSEAHYIGVQIREMTSQKGYAYRDIGIVCGDISSYAPYFEREFALMGIPYYLDCVNPVLLNPLVETVQSFLEVQTEDYSPAAVTRFLKAGLSGLTLSETDLIDNYVRQTGIRGYGAWHREFTRLPKHRKNGQSYLEDINDIRRKVIACFVPFEEEDSRAKRSDTAANYTEKLYGSLMNLKAPEKMRDKKRAFEEEGEEFRAREYGNIWKLFVELFDKIWTLIGEEPVSIDSFEDIVNAGIGEMRVPGLPQSVDRVLVGDIERSRLSNIKVLFFAGVNDGNIPADTSGKGIISDLDREYLSDSGVNLSPTPRQKMYIQRQYLYMNICKPSDELFLSYSRVRVNGKSVRPSYLIPMVKRILPYTEKVSIPENAAVDKRVCASGDALGVLSEMMREYADSQGRAENAKETFALFAAIEDAEKRDLITRSVYKRYLAVPLSAQTADVLYPPALYGSVSSLETYAGCPYRYFLNFGLAIKPADSYEIMQSDRGSLVHEIIKDFSGHLSKDGISWSSFTDEYAENLIPELAQNAAATYGSSMYLDNSRNRYNILRLSRLVINSVKSLRGQLAAGSFENIDSEKPFAMDLDLGGGRSLHMTGMIDRIDAAERDGKKYIQIIDYKSGDKDIDIPKILDGRQIQLPLYMYKEVDELGGIPASLLYFHIQDPYYDLGESGDLEKADEELRKKMRAKGELLSDEEALSLLDKDLTGLPASASSEHFRVGIKKDGTFTSVSRVIDKKIMERLLDESVKSSKREAREIISGKISAEPYASACKYCPYSQACGFDKKIPGYKTRPENKMSRKEAIELLGKDDTATKATDDSEKGGNEDGI